MNNRSIINLSEKTLIEKINEAEKRVVYIAPGITQLIVKAIELAWERLGTNSVTVVLDVDPEVCRLGYGTIEGLDLLRADAEKYGTLVCYHKEGVRIGLLISDNTTLI